MPGFPLLGRDRELAALRALLERARQGSGGAVLLLAEAGGGKTRLAQKAAAMAAESGMSVLWGAGSETTETVPLLPIAAALNNADLEAVRARLTRAHRLAAAVAPLLFPDETPPPIDDALKPALFESLLGVAVAAGEGRGTLLVIDDAHWADSTTRQLLVHAAARAPRLPLAVLVTTRVGEPATESLAQSPGVERLPLSALGAGDVARLGAAVLGRDPAPDLVDRVANRSAGNPFAAVELFAAASRAQLGEALPTRVRDAVLGRARELGGVETSALRALAVLGLESDLAELRAVAGLDNDGAVRAVADLARRGLLEDLGRGRVRFRHALIRDAVESELEAADLVALHTRAADVLSGSGTPPARLAHHLAAAGRRAEALPVAIAAASQASLAAGYVEASLLYEAAAAWTEDAGRQAALLEKAAQAAVDARDAPRAVRLAEASIARSLNAGGIPGRARTTLGFALLGMGDVEPARKSMRQAIEELRPDGATADLAWALIAAASLEMSQSLPEETMVIAEEALATADAAGDAVSLLIARGAVAWAEGWLRPSAGAMEVIDSLIPDGVAMGLHRTVLNGFNNVSMIRFSALRGREALELAPTFERSTHGTLAAHVDRTRLQLLALLGDPEAALAIDLEAGLMSPMERARCQNNRAFALIQLDRVAEAEELLISHPADPGAVNARVRADVACGLESGDIAAAREAARAALVAPSVRPVGIEAAVEALVAAGVEREAREAVRQAANRQPGDPWVELAAARVHGDPVTAETAAARFEAAGYWWDAVRGRLLAGDLLTRRGDRDAAVAQLTAGLQVATRTGQALLARHIRERLRALGAPSDEPTPDDVRAMLEDLGGATPTVRARLLASIDELAAAGGREAEAAAILRDYYVKKVGSQEVVAERHFLSRPTFYRRLHLGWKLLAERLGPLDDISRPR